jgi:hypothetical protein
MNVAYVGNQGGIYNLEFYVAMAAAARRSRPESRAFFLVWLESEKQWLCERGVAESAILVFETWVAQRKSQPVNAERLERDYPQAAWSTVVASERAIADYSFLMGASGQRREKRDYSERLVENVVTFFERAIAQFAPAAFVCQTPDTLYSHVLFKVLQERRIPAYAISPGWLFESRSEGAGFFANDEYLHSNLMMKKYRELQARDLTAEENARVDDLLHQITSFDGRTAFYQKMKRGSGFKANVWTPHIRNIVSYLRLNAARDPDAIYIKFDPVQKVKANLLRWSRRWTTRNLMQTIALKDVPARSVLYAMHFQPEQSTLAQGIFASNQIALLENVSKSLPLGYTLIVKEHPVGRGRRPAWQYKHLQGLPNVEFCDAPAKEIAKKADLVMTITGTIAVESLALGKPVVVFGRSFFNYSDLVNFVECPAQLHAVLHRILVQKRDHGSAERDTLLRKFFMSYLYGLIPYFPFAEHADHYADALIGSLQHEHA